MHRFCMCLVASALTATIAAAQEKTPRSLDPRLKIELFAEQPQIVTPTGIDVDAKGRVWAIESNTHFPPSDYAGHKSDRLLVMQDTNGDGRADQIDTFADGFTHAMSVAVRKSAEADKPDQVYVATRREISILTDTDGDLRADDRKRIVHLETAGNYPHNGLAGFAWDATGWMFFGFGENLGADYKIIGSDGRTLSGGGEGGNLYRCRPDGTQLSQWATGFWNPHASCIDAYGRMFTVDNDPDSRPPCRLLHIIRDGDYGYRFRNGRKGLHPFTAWNGEIPGTLPMVAGTGEAPSAVLSYESDGLPEEYLGNLLVTSWGDHRIDRFRLKAKGASYESLAEPLIVGGENFRPVGLSVAPDGSLYCTDWVLKDYKLHGKGRVWRISAVEPPKREVVDVTSITPQQTIERLVELLESRRIDVRHAAAAALRETNPGRGHLRRVLQDTQRPDRSRLAALYAMQSSLNSAAYERYVHTLTGGSAAFDRAFFLHLASSELPLDMKWERSPFVKVSGMSAPDQADAFADHCYRMLVALRLVAGADHEPFLIEHALAIEDPFVFHAVLQTIIQSDMRRADLELRLITYKESIDDPWAAAAATRWNLAWALAARQKLSQDGDLALRALRQPDPAVRRAGVQWIAEEKLRHLRPQVAEVLNESPMTTDLFLATLASLEMLDGVDPANFDKTPAGKYVLPILQDENRPAAVRKQALRLVVPDDRALKAPLFEKLLTHTDQSLRLEAVRTLQASPLAEAPVLLSRIAADEAADLRLRAEAIVGLGPAIAKAPAKDPLHKIVPQLLATPALKVETLRALRGYDRTNQDLRQLLAKSADSLDAARQEMAEELVRLVPEDQWTPGLRRVRESRPASVEAWMKRASEAGDAEAGRRVFFHVQGAGCWKCHTVDGRGGAIGPDLSMIARTMNRQKLAQSILEPAKEIAPQFTSWTFVMASGQTHQGMILGDTRDGKQRIGLADGKELELSVADIDQREPSPLSIMPANLIEQLTPSEFRHLLAFLESLK